MLHEVRSLRGQVIPFCSVAHSTPSLRPLVKNARLTGVVCLLGEFCAACGVNVWLGNGKARHELPDWRLPRGLLGLGGLRADAPSEARGACGERAGLAVAGDLVGLWQVAGDLAGQRRWSQIWWGYGQHWKTKGKWGTDTKNRRPVGHRLSVRHGGLEPSTR